MNTLKNIKHRLKIYEDIHNSLCKIIPIAISLRRDLISKSPTEITKSYDLMDICEEIINQDEHIIKKSKKLIDDYFSNRLKDLIKEIKQFTDIFREHNYFNEDLDKKFINIVSKIIELDSLLAKKEEYQEKDLRIIKGILELSPDDVYNHKKLLFRGLSHHEYKRLKHGYPIESDLKSRNTMEGHVVRRCDETNKFSSFISLTTDKKVAEHFGRLMIVDARKLEGELHTTDQLKKELGSSTHHYLNKNKEFLLAPSSNKPARIPASAVIWIAA